MAPMGSRSGRSCLGRARAGLRRRLSRRIHIRYKHCTLRARIRIQDEGQLRVPRMFTEDFSNPSLIPEIGCLPFFKNIKGRRREVKSRLNAPSRLNAILPRTAVERPIGYHVL